MAITGQNPLRNLSKSHSMGSVCVCEENQAEPLAGGIREEWGTRRSEARQFLIFRGSSSLKILLVAPSVYYLPCSSQVIPPRSLHTKPMVCFLQGQRKKGISFFESFRYIRASLEVQRWRYRLQCRRYKRCWFYPWVGKIRWRRVWQHIPVSFPGESHGQSSRVDYSPWGHKESDETEAT